MIETNYPKISIRRQSELLGLNRSSLYLALEGTDNNSELCNRIAEIYASYPIYGYRRITAMLRRSGTIVNRKLVQKLMREIGLAAIYSGPNTSKRNLQELVQAYLLEYIVIERNHQAWQIDITYLRTGSGFMYLVAIIDVHSRLIVGWRLSNSLCTISCISALEDAIQKYGKPEIINSDQGSQFTSDKWIEFLKKHEIKISMTGKGRSNDNAYIQRLWRAFKYEGSYLYNWASIAELKDNIPRWIYWYNNEPPHQSLGYKTPSEKYCESSSENDILPEFLQLHNIQNSQLIL